MKTEEFNKARSGITDVDLIEKAHTVLSELCKTGARSFTMTVPPSINDTDMIFGEVIRRFQQLVKRNQEIKDMIDEMVKIEEKARDEFDKEESSWAFIEGRIFILKQLRSKL